MTTELSHPIGRFQPPGTFTDASRAAAIAAIAAAPAKLRATVSDLSEAQLDTPYRPGGWTVRQVVHHVADSHLNAYIRTRLALTEDNPVIKTYEEQLWAELPDAKTLPIKVSLTMLDADTRQLLRALAERSLDALGVRERGPFLEDEMLRLFGSLAAAIVKGEDRERALRRAIAAAMSDYD